MAPVTKYPGLGWEAWIAFSAFGFSLYKQGQGWEFHFQRLRSEPAGECSFPLT